MLSEGAIMEKPNFAHDVERQIHSGSFRVYMTAWSALFMILFGFALVTELGRFAQDRSAVSGERTELVFYAK
jgi:hypothetical protein